MNILVINDDVVNIDNEEDTQKLLEAGARELTRQEIAAAGITGYEHLVSPVNTVVTDDGSIIFTPPEPPDKASLFQMLRLERDRRLAAADYLIMPDYPLDEATRSAITAYRQALRDFPGLDGAPWDGGGEATPWPVNPATR